jgi:hypothetical protein
MDWDEHYQKGEVFWDKGAPAPALRQYLECHAVRRRALVPGCGRGHEVALAVELGWMRRVWTLRRPQWRRRVRCIRSFRSVL